MNIEVEKLERQMEMEQTRRVQKPEAERPWYFPFEKGQTVKVKRDIRGPNERIEDGWTINEFYYASHEIDVVNESLGVHKFVKFEDLKNWNPEQ